MWSPARHAVRAEWPASSGRTNAIEITLGPIDADPRRSPDACPAVTLRLSPRHGQFSNWDHAQREAEMVAMRILMSLPRPVRTGTADHGEVWHWEVIRGEDGGAPRSSG